MKFRHVVVRERKPRVGASIARLTALALGALAIVVGTAVGAQESGGSLPEEAAKRLEHIIGAWDNRWEILDDQGEVVSVSEGTTTAEYLIDDRVVQLTTVTDSGISKAWQFYSVREGLYYQVSVSREGDLWTMSGGLDEWVVTSLPRRMPNGREVMIRFTHANIEEDSFDAVQEVSRDGGVTWIRRAREMVTRRADTH